MLAVADTLSTETIAVFIDAFGDASGLTEMFGRPKPGDDEMSSKELAEVARKLLNRATSVMDRLNAALDQIEPPSERGGDA